MRKATGNHLMNSTSLEKLRSLSLVSARLEIEYAMQFAVIELFFTLCAVVVESEGGYDLMQM